MITAAEYKRLKSAYEELSMLQAYGVDNWEGYDEAMAELYGEDYDDDE